MKRLLPFVVLVLAATTFAQIAPTVRYTGTGKYRRVAEMSNLLGVVEYMKCRRVSTPVVGRIVKRDFEEDEVTISRFVLADGRDERVPININDAQVGILGHRRNEIVSSLLSKGSKVQVWTARCSGGGSGIFTYAARIKVL